MIARKGECPANLYTPPIERVIEMLGLREPDGMAFQNSTTRAETYVFTKDQ